MAVRRVSNHEIAERLERVAELLELQEANPFRVRSYRRAADELRALDRPAAEIYEEGGAERLEEIRGVGERLAGSIGEIVETGRLGLLDRLAEGLDVYAYFNNDAEGHAVFDAADLRRYVASRCGLEPPTDLRREEA